MAQGTLLRMTITRFAAFAALVCGGAWLVKVALIAGNGGSNTDTGMVAAAYLIGLSAAAVALLAGGYTVVRTAPSWLRAVVSVATLMLGAVLFSAVDTLAKTVYAGEGWVRDEIGIAVSALVALGFGVLGLRRARRAAAGVEPAEGEPAEGEPAAAAPSAHRGGRRAARSGTPGA